MSLSLGSSGEPDYYASFMLEQLGDDDADGDDNAEGFMCETGNAGRAERISARNKALIDQGDCSHCSPHRGENVRRPDGKYRWDGHLMRFIPSKGKDRK